MHMVSNLHGPRAVDDLRRRSDMRYYVLAVYESDDDKFERLNNYNIIIL